LGKRLDCLRHGLLSRSGSSAVEGLLGLVEGINESVGISQEGDLSELVAAEDGQLAVEGGTLAANVEASGAARIREVHCRRDVATAEGVDTDGAADGLAEASTVSLLADALVEVVDLDVIVDLTARAKAEAALEHRGHVDLNTVLVDLNIGVLIGILGLAEKTRARVEDTLDAKAGLHSLIELSAIDDAESIGVLSVESRARRSVGVCHFSSRLQVENHK